MKFWMAATDSGCGATDGEQVRLSHSWSHQLLLFKWNYKKARISAAQSAPVDWRVDLYRASTLHQCFLNSPWIEYWRRKNGVRLWRQLVYIFSVVLYFLQSKLTIRKPELNCVVQSWHCQFHLIILSEWLSLSHCLKVGYIQLYVLQLVCLIVHLCNKFSWHFFSPLLWRYGQCV